MNIKLTIRLIGYSLIAVWAIWLFGRSGDIDPQAVDTTTVLSDRKNGNAGDVGEYESLRPGTGTLSDRGTTDSTEEPLPLVESEKAKSVRMYIDLMVSTDDGIDRLMGHARQSPDNPAWSTPIRSAINGVIRVTERDRFESGELYVECSGLLCFIRGDLNIDTTLTQLPLELWAASNRGGASFATATSQKSQKYGWVFVVAAPDFEIPADR